MTGLRDSCGLYLELPAYVVLEVVNVPNVTVICKTLIAGIVLALNT